ncbi:hypothetical protein SDC9_79273 [bioreactor metagenome]|uniref:Uncharacterized protein n=1 Tax=bioreactor metagenome TaxID=1076179 RepID=A0A644YXH1_9ZZZZ
MDIEIGIVAVLEGGSFFAEKDLLIDRPIDERDDIKPAARIAGENAEAAELNALAFLIHTRADHAGTRRVADPYAVLYARHYAEIPIVADKTFVEPALLQAGGERRALLFVIRAGKTQHRVLDIGQRVAVCAEHLTALFNQQIRRVVKPAGHCFMVAAAAPERGDHFSGRIE